MAQPPNVNGTQPPDRVPFADLSWRSDVPDPSATPGLTADT